MAAPMARDGRRRRVLNDEVRTASSLSLAAYTQASEPDAPRYGEQASVENHPQITDYVPRRKRAVIVTLLAGLGVAGGAEALRHFAEPVAASLPGAPSSALLSSVAAGATAWTSAVVLLLCAMLAKLIYSLRRHRVDDYAGRYRVWRWIAWGAFLASVNATVGIGQTIAALCMAATGKSLTANGAEWWLAPLAVVSAWIAVRLAFEIGESRSSLVFMLGAATCYAAAGVAALGWSPANVWASVIVGALPLAGHTLALAGLMIFGRYVVLDVQGLIEHKPRPVRVKAPQKRAESAPAVKLAATPVQAAAAKSVAQTQRPTASDASDEEAWDSDADDTEEPGRRLSKAERKALRRHRRAA
jgi:hypothetical protein